MVKCSKSEIQRLKTALRWKIPAVQRERIQMVLQREGGLTQPAIAAAMGVSLSTVNRAHMAYHQGGIKALKPKPNGGHKHENMTLAEEKALLPRVAKRAGAGEMLNIHDLKAAYEGRAGLPNPARQHLPPVRPRVCTDDSRSGCRTCGAEGAHEHRVAPALSRQHCFVVTQLASHGERMDTEVAHVAEGQGPHVVSRFA